MRIIFTVFLVIGTLVSYAQDYPRTDTLYERVWLATDRDVFIPGDEVRLSLATIDGYYQLPVVFSAVAYIELFSADGSPIIQEKALLHDGRGSAVFALPKDLKTGFYYIRAYTNFQKNYGEHSFMTKKIRLVNPFKVIPIDIASDSGESQARPLASYLFRNDSLIVTCDPTLSAQGLVLESAFGVGALMDRAERRGDSVLAFPLYGQKSLFSIEAHGDLLFVSDSASGIELIASASADSISFSAKTGTITNHIAAVSAFHAGHGIYTDTYIMPAGKVAAPARFDFKPELRTDLIFGSVTLKDGGIMPNNILASMPGNTSLLLVAKVHPDGSFAVAMDGIDGNTPVLLTPTDSSSRINISLQTEFFTRFAPIAGEEYKPERHLGEYIQSLMVNVQLADAFAATVAPRTAPGNVFYGRWDESITFSQFILLPSMEEYIHELMPSVYVYKKKKRKSIRISDYDHRGFIGNKPLLLVDGTPFYNHGTVLYIPPKEVMTVNILNRKLSYMTAQFDGILDIRTRDNFAEALELSSNAVSIEYIAPKFETGNPPASMLFRNTQYWHPVCDDSISGDFGSSTQKKACLLRVQGIGDGKAFDVYSHPLK